MHCPSLPLTQRGSAENLVQSAGRIPCADIHPQPAALFSRKFASACESLSQFFCFAGAQKKARPAAQAQQGKY